MAGKSVKSPGAIPGLDGLKTGTYVLILFLEQARMIQIGKLGSYTFPRGYYAYIGSAFGTGGLPARILRHMKTGKSCHWHIDYLRPHADVQEAWVFGERTKLEHKWAYLIRNLPGADVVTPGFGCSDCTCLTHLFHFDSRPSFRRFARAHRTISPSSPAPLMIPLS